MAVTNYDNMSKMISSITQENKFEVGIIGLPTFLNSTILENITLYAKGTSIPSATAVLNKIRIGNIERSSFSDLEVDSVIVTFYDLKEQELLKFFRDWHTKSVFSDEFGNRQYYPDDYQSTINIKVNNEVTWELTKSFPVTVGDFQLNYDSEDSLGTFDVTFNVHRVIPK